MQLKYVKGLYIIAIVGSLFGQQKALTIEKLEALVKQRNPELIAFSKEIKASEGSLLQKSLRLNPELDMETGTGVDPETILRFDQTFELGRKRLKRTNVGKLELEKTKLDYHLRQLEILKEAKAAFVDVLVDQQTIKLIEDKIMVSKEFLSIVKNKVSAGRFSPAEESRAKVVLVSNGIELIRAKRTLKNNWKVLASFWGSTSPVFDTAIGNLDSIGAIPSEQFLTELIEQSPVLSQTELDIKIQESVMTLEQANRIPDLTMGAGVKRIDIPGNTYELGVSIPLPLFNRNQGAIMEARAQLDWALDNKQVIEIQLRTEVQTFYSELLMAYDEIQSLKTTILPEAENAYRIINDGYLQGKFDYLDVVDAQNTLFEGRESLLLALSEYQKARLELERLLGQSLNSIPKSVEE